MYWIWFIKTLAQHLQFCWTNMAKLKTSPNFTRRHNFQIVGKLPHHPPTENSSLFLITGWLLHDPFISCSLWKASSFHYSICAAPGFPFNLQLPSQKTNHKNISSAELPKPLSLLPNIRWTSWHFPQRFPSTGSPVPCSNDPLPCSTNPRQQSWTKCSPATKIQRGRDWRVK